MKNRVLTIDIEGSGLLKSMVDYSAFPYKLLPSARLWCVVVRDVNTGEYWSAEKEFITKDWLKKVLKDCKILIAHNGIKFDFLVLQLFGLLDYTIGYLGEPDTIFGNTVTIIDTLVLSRLLSPDRYDNGGGHSLEVWGIRVGYHKDDYRKKCIEAGYIKSTDPDGAEFLIWNPLMLPYCLQDNVVTGEVFKVLWEKFKSYSGWEKPLKIENKLADRAIRRENIGFWFDRDLALKNISWLETEMKRISDEIDPILPPKPCNKTELSYFTPPKIQLKTHKPVYLPKVQVKKDGNLSSAVIKFLSNQENITYKEGSFSFWFDGSSYELPYHEPLVPEFTEPTDAMVNFAEKVGGNLDEIDGEWILFYKGRMYTLPFYEPLETEIPATVDNIDHVKQYLIDLGWKPLEFKQRDLTKDSKKQSIPYEKRLAALQRYVKETLEEGKYKEQRLEILMEERIEINESNLYSVLSEKIKGNKPVYVPTSPCVRVGVEKELCPNLLKLGDKVSFVKDFSLYLTYKHRKNSIAGGVTEDFDYDEDSPPTGYLSQYREVDGRIPTPAIEIGCNTNRYKHIGVANIPRVKSVFGEEMRSMFGSGKEFWEFGFDFSSLENCISGHYVTPFSGGKELAKAMVATKPNDLHSLNAKKLGISRDDAKSFSYACLPMQTRVLTVEGWKYFDELSEGDSVLSYNPATDSVEPDTILKKHFFSDKEVVKVANSRSSFLSTSEHRWYGWWRTGRGKTKRKVNGFFKTENITSEYNLLLSAPYVGGNADVSEDEAALLGWILSDGTISWSKSSNRTSASFGKRKKVSVTITQAEHKFVNDIEILLKKLDVDYGLYIKQLKNQENIRLYSISSPWAREFLDRVVFSRQDKHDINWSEWVISLPRKSLESFLEAFFKGDGNSISRDNNKEYVITQNKGNIFDAVLIAMQLIGDGRITINSKGEKYPNCLSLRKQHGRHMTCQNVSKENVGVQDTFCLTTNNSTFIIWQDDFIGITGNCLYGAQPPKLAKMLSISLNKAKQLYNDFWDAMPALKALKEKLEKYWEGSGRQFILGLDGRRIFTRSKHSLLNALFQSGGVIATKYTTLFMLENFENQGYCVDPFVGTPDVCSMIEYHDEVQLLIKQGLVEIKTFETKDLAEEFVSNWKGSQLSPISEGKRGHYIALPSPVSLTIEESIAKACQELRLRVSLGFEYKVNRTWAGCH